MSMAFRRVRLNTHQRRRMVHAVQKMVQIDPDVRPHDMLVVPLPDNLARSRSDRLRANITRNPKLWKMNVLHIARLQQTLKLPLLRSGRYMLTGFCPMSIKVRNSRRDERVQKVIGSSSGVPNGEEVRDILGAHVIPGGLVCDLMLY